VSQESSDYTECPNLNGLLILWQAIVPALYPLAILPFDQSRHPPVDTIRSVTDPPRVPARWTLILLQVGEPRDASISHSRGQLSSRHA
jgi:hypothetical protein